MINLEETTFFIGTRVVAIADNSSSGYEYKKGDIFTITDLRGLFPGTRANSTNNYFATKLTDGCIHSVRHGDMAPLNQVPHYLLYLKIYTKRLQDRKKEILEKLNFYRKYEDLDDFIMREVITEITSKSKIQDVRKMLRNKLPADMLKIGGK